MTRVRASRRGNVVCIRVVWCGAGRPTLGRWLQVVPGFRPRTVKGWWVLCVLCLAGQAWRTFNASSYGAVRSRKDITSQESMGHMLIPGLLWAPRVVWLPLSWPPVSLGRKDWSMPAAGGTRRPSQAHSLRLVMSIPALETTPGNAGSMRPFNQPLIFPSSTRLFPTAWPRGCFTPSFASPERGGSKTLICRSGIRGELRQRGIYWAPAYGHFRIWTPLDPKSRQGHRNKQ